MGSISPFDSASQGASSDGRGDARVAGPGDLVGVLEKLALLGVSDQSLVASVVRTWSGAYHAYVRSGSSSEVGGSGVSWADSRAAVPERGKQFSPSVPGYCYLSAVREGRRQELAVRLGPDPTLEALSGLGRELLVDDRALESLHLVRRGSSYHVQAVPGPGSEVLSVALDSVRRGAGLVRARVEPGLAVGAADLRETLVRMVGQPRFERLVQSGVMDGDFSVVVRSAALLESPAKRHLRVLEALGDAVVTHELARACVARGLTVQEYQAARSACTNNSSMSALFVDRMPVDLFTFPSGVKPGHGNVGAKTLEAIVGMVDFHAGAESSRALVQALGLLGLAGVPVLSPTATVGRLDSSQVVLECMTDFKLGRLGAVRVAKPHTLECQTYRLKGGGMDVLALCDERANRCIGWLPVKPGDSQSLAIAAGCGGLVLLTSDSLSGLSADQVRGMGKVAKVWNVFKFGTSLLTGMGLPPGQRLDTAVARAGLVLGAVVTGPLVLASYPE